MRLRVPRTSAQNGSLEWGIIIFKISSHRNEVAPLSAELFRGVEALCSVIKRKCCAKKRSGVAISDRLVILCKSSLASPRGRQAAKGEPFNARDELSGHIARSFCALSVKYTHMALERTISRRSMKSDSLDSYRRYRRSDPDVVAQDSPWNLRKNLETLGLQEHLLRHYLRRLGYSVGEDAKNRR